MRLLKGPALAVALATLIATGAWAQEQKKPLQGKPGPRAREGALKVGDAAPDFTVKDMRKERTVRLSDLKGKPVVLFFGSCT
jgi:cytochrome oxidase Cu insertion factor (SCO1/SenC/PrrC family)